MLKGHLQAWTWQDEWDGLTMEVKYLELFHQDTQIPLLKFLQLFHIL